MYNHPPNHRPAPEAVVIPNPTVAAPTAADTGVTDLVDASVRVPVAGANAGALRLCAICALTRWPAARALHSESSPASTAAATMRARRRALSPGFVGCEPRTPSISSMADWVSRIVPPPIVPTSMEGMETLIWRLPFVLLIVWRKSVSGVWGWVKKGGGD